MSIINPRTRAPFLDEDKKAVTIRMRGRNSDAYRNAQREVALQRAEREAAGIRSDNDDFLRERAFIMQQVTTGWSFDKLAGEAFAFSPENALRLWTDGRWPWLVEQAFTFFMEDANFLGN